MIGVAVAEGFGIYFASPSSWSSIRCTLGLSSDLTEWQIPEGTGHVITIRRGVELTDCHSEDQLREIKKRLGVKPALTLSVELRRSRQPQAVTLARDILLRLSFNHRYLVDDGVWDLFEASLWSTDDVRGKIYRDGLPVLGIYG